jgi:hypothetical protein
MALVLLGSSFCVSRCHEAHQPGVPLAGVAFQLRGHCRSHHVLFRARGLYVGADHTGSGDCFTNSNA